MLKRKMLLLGLAAIGNTYAAYDAEDAVKLSADAAYLYDSNVFRLSDKQENRSTLRYGQKSDSSVTAGVGAIAELPVSRQLVYARANLSYSRYFTFDELNNSAWDLGLGWNWVVGNQWKGNLSASTTRALSSFDDVRVSVVDTVKTDRFDWSANYQLLSNWSLLANAGYIQERHDVRKYQDANNRSIGGGVSYVSDRGLNITLRHSWSKHAYEQDLIIPASLRGYSTQDTRLGFSWPVTEKFVANMNFGYNQSKSDFDGRKSTRPVGSFDLVWKVTPKTTLRTGAGQNFDVFGSSFVGRDLERTAYIAADWRVTDKSKFTAQYNYRQLETQLSTGRLTQDAIYDTYRIAFDYEVLRSLMFRSFVEFSTRDEKINQFDYNDEQIGVSLKYNF